MDFLFDIPETRLLDDPIPMTRTDHEEDIKEYLRGVYADAKVHVDRFNEPVIRDEISKMGDRILREVRKNETVW
jgi:hypothetical protein